MGKKRSAVELTYVSSSRTRHGTRRRRRLALRRPARRAARRDRRGRGGGPLASGGAHADGRRAEKLAAQHLHPARQRAARRHGHAESEPRRPGPCRRSLDPDRARRRHLSGHRIVARRAAAGLSAQDGVLGRRRRSSPPTWRCCRCSAPGWPTTRCSARSDWIRCPAKARRCRCPTAVSSAGCAGRASSWTSSCRVTQAADWLRPADRGGCAAGRGLGLRGASGGRAAAAARGRHRRADDPARSGLDRRRAVHLDKGCYRGQETVARVHNLGKPPRMLVLLHLDGSADRPATGDPVLAGGRAGRPARHRRRPRRPRPGRAGAAQARAARRHRADHRRRGRGRRRDRRRLDAGRRRRPVRAGWRSSGCGAEHGERRSAVRRACQRSAAGHGKVLAGQ